MDQVIILSMMKYKQIIKFKIVENDKKYLFETLINLSSLKLKFKNLDYLKKEGTLLNKTKWNNQNKIIYF